LFGLGKSKPKETNQEECPMFLLHAKNVKEWRNCVNEVLIQNYYALEEIKKTEATLIKVLGVSIALLSLYIFGQDVASIVLKFFGF